ncbi:MAG: acyl-CoA synthetase FdrA [Bacillota bacterium]
MIFNRVFIKPNAYFDSVVLMAVSRSLKELAGVEEAVLAMGTEMNKELLARVGLATAEALQATPNDLMVGIKANEAHVLEEAVALAGQKLKGQAQETGSETAKPRSLAGGLMSYPETNLVLISVPGLYAAREARRALEAGRHVMLFSDNVPLEEEIALKDLASQRGLLLMGPDCGTAIINGVPLGFANAVRQGSIGVVGASGTGTQEVTSIIHRLGAGVSQVIGTGGRDLSGAVAGRTTLAALEALGADPATRVIVVISKPPAREVARRVLDKLAGLGKPVVVHFLGGDQQEIEKRGLIAGRNLADTARKAVSLAQGLSIPVAEPPVPKQAAQREAAAMAPFQRWVRGLFGGGTLCDEAMFLLGPVTGGIFSNVAVDSRWQLPDPLVSKEHTMLDMGDDFFTVGRPHPMIEPVLRVSRLFQEAADPEVAVVLMDVVLGYGSHRDPAGVLAPAIAEAKETARLAGRYLSLVVSLCGTDQDPQNLAEQERQLAEAGALVLPTNAEAALLAAEIITQRTGGRNGE